MSRIRVAILGGGCGGIAAAEALSATAALRARFEVTVYQVGFRLGGKGATGRNRRQGQRIEEHGLHVWMGFYRRAFGMMRRCFEEWDAPRGACITTIEEAFEPGWVTTMLGRRPDGTLDPWRIPLPPRPGRPWDEEHDAIDWNDFGRALLRYGRGLVARHAEWSDADGRRRALTMARLTRAVTTGLLRDVLPHGEAGFDRIDDYNLDDWLIHHGASARDLREAPLVQGLYNLAFAFPDGRPGVGKGRVAAGAGLRSLLLIVGGYRGAPFWRMRAGMGDTIFAPLYQVLSRRGVRFEFFHRVERLRPDERGGVGMVEIDRQAQPRGDGYEPLVTVKGQPCWPDEPDVAQLIESPAVDFERERRRVGVPRRLERGRDFDEVVIAIPAPAHRDIAGELIERSPAYRAMIESTHSVATIAMQLWLTPTVYELGWRDEAPLVTGLPGLFGTWGDMSDVLDAEAWPERPGSSAYFCEAIDDAACEGPGALDRLRERAERWLDESLVPLWPGAGGPDGRFRRDLLVATSGDRWGAQYLRINHEPSERYVLSLPGTTRHRLAPGETGFDNLTFAGDWTRSRINGGSVEAAVESGQRAAEAIRHRHRIARVA